MTSKAFIDAFRKASFDLVKEYSEERVKHPDVDNIVVKNDDDGIWIRFTAIGSLLDYCVNNETKPVFLYCLKGAALAMLIDDLVKRDHK